MSGGLEIVLRRDTCADVRARGIVEPSRRAKTHAAADAARACLPADQTVVVTQLWRMPTYKRFLLQGQTESSSQERKLQGSRPALRRAHACRATRARPRRKSRQACRRNIGSQNK